MRKFTAALAICLCACLVMTGLVQAAPTPTPRDFDKLAPNGVLSETAITAKHGMLMDASTGKILFEKDANTRTYPASTTKIMTALIALEQGDLSESITAPKLPNIPKDATNIDLKEGETLTLEELLYGLMLRSGNDAGNAIAIHLGGSVEGFASMMNEKAAELGMTGTHYTNPHGLHEEEHYTTAHDMAILTRAAMDIPMFKTLVGTYEYKMRATNKHSDPRTWTNTNRLISTNESQIYAYEYATGVKTGFTNAAQFCLVSSAKKGDVELIAVAMYDGTDSRFVGSITMFEYGFAFYDTLDAAPLLGDLSVTIKVAGAADGQSELHAIPTVAQSTYVTEKKDIIAQLRTNPDQFRQELDVPELTAPIARDQSLGNVLYYYGDQLVASFSLVAGQNVAALESTPSPSPLVSQSVTPPPQEDNSKAKPGGIPWYVYVLVIGGVLLVFAVVWLLVNLARPGGRHGQNSRNRRRPEDRRGVSRSSSNNRGRSRRR